jgi:hypothetical protein
MELNIGLGIIEITTPNGLSIRAYKPDTQATGSDAILFCNHATNAEYSFPESVLKNAEQSCSLYRVDVVKDSISYNESAIEYCYDANSDVVDITLFDGSIHVPATELMLMLYIINRDDKNVIQMKHEIRRNQCKELYNLTDEQYDALEQHFTNM